MSTPLPSTQRFYRRRAFVVLTALSLALGLGTIAANADGPPITVTNTNDAGAGSLRDAINQANLSEGDDSINFDIDGAGPYTIQLSTSENNDHALPRISEAVTIDATSQNGYDGNPVVELLGQGSEEDAGQAAFYVQSSGVVIRGLSIANFAEGVRLAPGSSGSVIEDNQFGMLLDGSDAYGVLQSFAVGALAGSDHVIRANWIGNVNRGVLVTGETTTDSVINANYIGVTPSGNAVNMSEGVTVNAAGFGNTIRNNVIGGDENSSFGVSTTATGGVSIDGNSIGSLGEDTFPGRSAGGIFIDPSSTNLSVYNNDVGYGSGPGIRITATSVVAGNVNFNAVHDNTGDGIRITGDYPFAIVESNTLWDNGGLGIDVGTSGVNDVEGEQAGPQIVDIQPGVGGTASVKLEYNGSPDWETESRTVEFANNSVCDPSGYGEARWRLEPQGLNLDDSGDFFGWVELDGENTDIVPGDLITAHFPGGNSRAPTELSNCAEAGTASQPPTASSGNDGTAFETPVLITLFGDDPDGDDLTFDISNVSNGTTGPIGEPSCSDGSCSADVTFYPADGFSGDASIEFSVSDGEDTSESATVTIVVDPPDSADLTLSLTDAPDPVTSGGSVAYIATVQNLGPSTAGGAEFLLGDAETGELPSDTSFVSGSVVSPTGEVGGQCYGPGEGGAGVSCSFDNNELPASPTDEWTITIVLETGSESPSTLNVEASIQSWVDDPVPSNNSAFESTTVDPAGDDQGTTYIPPDADEPVLIATSETVEFNGNVIPAAQPNDTVAGAMLVPPAGPGGVVNVQELECESPFCAAAGVARAPSAPDAPPLENRVVQFDPPTDPFYNYQNPLRFRIYYDVSILEGLLPRDSKAFYTKDSEPDVLLRAHRCDEPLTETSAFPCVKSKNIVEKDDPAIFGDLRIVLLGTYNDPKAAGFR